MDQTSSPYGGTILFCFKNGGTLEVPLSPFQRQRLVPQASAPGFRLQGTISFGSPLPPGQECPVRGHQEVTLINLEDVAYFTIRANADARIAPGVPAYDVPPCDDSDDYDDREEY